MIAMKGGGEELLSTTVRLMKGIFHRQLLVAAGGTLCPFIRTTEENVGCTNKAGKVGTSSALERGGRLEEHSEMAYERVLSLEEGPVSVMPP